MRELEFLPTWYPAIQRQRRSMMTQVWVTLICLICLATYAGVERAKLHTASRATAQIEAKIGQSQLQLTQLDEKLKYEDELRRQEQIVSRLGITIDATRVLKALEDAMTPDMALTDVSLETVEQAQSDLPEPTRQHNSQSSDRLLKVQVDGIAPTDLDVAKLLEHLQKVGCFDHVTPPYMRDGQTRNGHVMREFEITFDIDLNTSDGERR